MRPINDFLLSNPSHLFHGMDREHLEQLLECAEERVLKRGEFVFRAGDEATHFYLIYNGELAVQMPGYERGDSTIQHLTTGEMVGISWIMKPYEYRFDAMATEPSRLLAFDADILRDKVRDDYRFGYEVIMRFTHAIAKRLEATRLQMKEMAREAAGD